MADHTPGPWMYHAPSGWVNADHCCERGPMHVADIRGWGHLTGHGHGAHALKWDDAKLIQEANGHLIAAAPELLEALKRALAGMRFTFAGSDDDFEETRLVKFIRAAISKATGGHG